MRIAQMCNRQMGWTEESKNDISFALHVISLRYNPESTYLLCISLIILLTIASPQTPLHPVDGEGRILHVYGGVFSTGVRPELKSDVDKNVIKNMLFSQAKN